MDAKVKEWEEKVKEREEKLREREKVITNLILAGGGGAATVKSEDNNNHVNTKNSLESTFGSRGGTQRGFDAFLGRFDQYKEELEKKERDLA